MSIDYSGAGAALKPATAVNLQPVLDELEAVKSSVQNIPSVDLGPLQASVNAIDAKVTTHSDNFDAFVTGILG